MPSSRRKEEALGEKRTVRASYRVFLMITYLPLELDACHLSTHFSKRQKKNVQRVTSIRVGGESLRVNW